MSGTPAKPSPATLLNGEPGSAKLATPPASGMTKPRSPLRRWARRGGRGDELRLRPLDACGEGGVAEQRCPLGCHRVLPRRLHCAPRGAPERQAADRLHEPYGVGVVRALPRRTVASVGSVRVLVTGGAGFIGSHVADRLAAEGHEPVVLDALIPQAHGGEQPPWDRGTSWSTATSATPDALRRGCCAGSTPCATRPRWSGHGVDARRRARPTPPHNDLGTAVLLAAMYEAGVCRLVLAGSMVVYGEGRYTAASTASSGPGPRARRAIAAGRFEPPCPRLRPRPRARPRRPRTRRSTRAAPTPPPSSPRSTWRARGRARPAARSWSLRYHNVYGPRMPRDTPYAGVASVFRSALERGEAPRVMEDGRQRRDFVHVTRRRRGQRARADERPARGRLHGGERLLRRAAHRRRPGDGRWPRRAAVPSPVVVGGARPGDVRHVVADPARATALLGFTGARWGSPRACARSRPTRCAPGPDGRRHRTVSGRGPTSAPRPEDRGVDAIPRSSFPAWTRPRRCRSCWRRCPRAGPCSSWTTAPPTAPPRWPARSAPGSSSSRAGATAPRCTPGWRRPAPSWSRCSTGTARSTPRCCPAWPTRSLRPGRSRRRPPGAAGPGVWPWHARAGNAVVAALLRRRGRAGARHRPRPGRAPGGAARARGRRPGVRLPAGAAAARRRGGMADLRGPGGVPARGPGAGRRSPAPCAARCGRPGTWRACCDDDRGVDGAHRARGGRARPGEGARARPGQDPAVPAADPARGGGPGRRRAAGHARCRACACPAARGRRRAGRAAVRGGPRGELAAALRGSTTRRSGARIWGTASPPRTATPPRLLPGRPVLQIGMDTPQVDPALLADAAGPLRRGTVDAVLGPADGRRLVGAGAA